MLEQHNNQFEFSEKDFKFLVKIANEETGIVLADHKKAMVYSRLTKRLRALKLDSFADYCDLLQSEEGKDEIGNLVNAITTNLTSFFRENHHFDHLKKILSEFNERKLRIWSAGCSSGMEPYSIAMVLKAAELKNVDAKILATDIDSNMLATAAAGRYNIDDAKTIPDAYSRFIKAGSDKTFIIKDEIKELITFKQLNLLEGWPMKGQFDMIFCRNVVIYFDKPTKQKLFARMADQIKPKGWLYIGHSESLHGINDRFELLGRTTYRSVK